MELSGAAVEGNTACHTNSLICPEAILTVPINRHDATRDFTLDYNHRKLGENGFGSGSAPPLLSTPTSTRMSSCSTDCESPGRSSPTTSSSSITSASNRSATTDFGFDGRDERKLEEVKGGFSQALHTPRIHPRNEQTVQTPLSKARRRSLEELSPHDVASSRRASGVSVSELTNAASPRPTVEPVAACANVEAHHTNGVEPPRASGKQNTKPVGTKSYRFPGITSDAFVSASCMRELLRQHRLRQSRTATLGACTTMSASGAANVPQFLLAISQQLQPILPIQDDWVFYESFFPQVICRYHTLFGCAPCCSTVAIIYFERLLGRCPHLIVPQNTLPILYGIILALAAKFVDDALRPNSYYALCLGLELRSFNRVEQHVLNALEYRLFVHHGSFVPLRRIFSASAVMLGRQLKQTCGLPRAKLLEEEWSNSCCTTDGLTRVHTAQGSSSC